MDIIDDIIHENAIKEVITLMFDNSTLTYNLSKKKSSLRDMVIAFDDNILEDAIKEVAVLILDRSNPHLQLGQE